MDYLGLLEYSYEVEKTGNCAPSSRLEYLGESIFGFITYDGEMSVLFARKAVDVCAAINNRKTFDFIKEDQENYKWFLLMCNMPFFAERLECGTSIRGAWWGAFPGKQIEFQSCGLWIGEDQCTDAMKFSREEWEKFIRALIKFAEPEMEVPTIQGQGE